MNLRRKLRIMTGAKEIILHTNVFRLGSQSTHRYPHNLTFFFLMQIMKNQIKIRTVRTREKILKWSPFEHHKRIRPSLPTELGDTNTNLIKTNFGVVASFDKLYNRAVQKKPETVKPDQIELIRAF